MMKLADIYLSDELTDKLADKLEAYNNKHPEEKISFQELAKLFMEYGIRYLDITAIE